MALAADLRSQLDWEDLLSSLVGDLGGAAAALTGVELDPQAAAGAAEAGERQQAIDLSAVSAPIADLAGALAPIAETLVPDAASLAPIQDALDLAEQLGSGDLKENVENLIEELTRMLDGSQEGGFVEALSRAAHALAGESADGSLQALLSSLLGRLGSSDLASLDSLARGSDAVAALARVVGGLMSLETVLSEADRVAEVMSRSADAERLRASVSTLRSWFTSGETRLSTLLSGLDVTQPAEVDAAVAAVEGAARALRSFDGAVSESLGFAEASLVHLDLGRVNDDLSRAAAAVRDPALDAVKTWLAGMVSGLEPILSVDLDRAPGRTLEVLLGELDGAVTQLASEIGSTDVATVTDPVNDAVDELATLFDGLAGAILGVTRSIEEVFARARDAIAALPVDAVASAIRGVLDPIAELLELVTNVVGGASAAVTAAAGAAQTAIDEAQSAIDRFLAALNDLFDAAKQLIEGLNLSAITGEITEASEQVADLIGQAAMKPYFDTVAGAIGDAADVIDMVPFELLPDDMEQDVAEALRPVRETDAGAIAGRVKTLLQVEADGSFALRGELEGGLAQLQAAYDDVVAVLEQASPAQLVEPLETAFAEVRGALEGVESIDFGDLRAAVDGLHAQVEALDLDAALAPLREGFDAVLAKVDELHPDSLVAPLETRLRTVREALVERSQIESWSERLDSLREGFLEAAELFDPERLEALLEEAIDEGRSLLAAAPDLSLSASFGHLLAPLMAGSGLRIDATAFARVIARLGGGSAAADLSGLASRVADAVDAARAAVDAVDVDSLRAEIEREAAAVRAAVDTLPAGAPRDRLQAALARLDPGGVLAPLGVNVARVRESLAAAAGDAARLRQTGFSEADEAADRLAAAVEPFTRVSRFFLDALERIGIAHRGRSTPALLAALLDEVPAARLAGLTVPILTALRGRARELADGVFDPLQSGLARVRGLIDLLDLGPLREALAGAHAEARARIEELHPDRLLGEVVGTFAGARSEVLAFDPLADLEALLGSLRTSRERLLRSLDPETLVQKPTEVHALIVSEIRLLDLERLGGPIFRELDVVAAQVDEGLDVTVTSFEALQRSLPAA